jgi:hypothetical protein|tara:strand:+ start:5871 stop:6602 length:732 start_codon:yes stop_codon:yes gene_type:complete
MTKLFLSTPCYGGLCLEKYVKSVIQLQLLLVKEQVQLMIDTTENESLVHRARNVSIGRFMQKTDADFFLFIDADIEFDPKAVLRLLKSGHDISVAVYPKKVVMWDQARKAVEDGDTREMSLLSSSLVANIGAKKRSVVNGFVEVLDGPTGFMMISRDALVRMHEHYGPTLTCKNDHQNRDFDDYCALFDCMIDPDNRRYLSEDYAFCRRWQQMGGKIFADCNTTLGHVGNLPFSGCLNERLKA